MLIDGDNVPVRGARRAFPAVARLGKVTLCRVYGKLPRAARPSWRAAANEVPGVPVPHFRDRTGASTAPAICVDLEDLAAARVDGICFLSWDSDLGEAVARAQAAGLRVHVFARADAARLTPGATSFHPLD